MMDVNTLPMHEVNAMGRKLPGSDGFACALDLGMSLMTAFFHIAGTWLVIRQVLNRYNSAGWREGQRFKMVYGMSSSGLGDDPQRHLFKVAVQLA